MLLIGRINTTLLTSEQRRALDQAPRKVVVDELPYTFVKNGKL
jgi:hypothetical protein